MVPGCSEYDAVMIRDIQISAISDDETIYEPPQQALVLSVIGGSAALRINDYTESSPEGPGAELASIYVPARSLLYALQAAINDNEKPS